MSLPTATQWICPWCSAINRWDRNRWAMCLNCGKFACNEVRP